MMAISKFTNVDKRRTDEEKNSVLKQIIDNAIIADGVPDVFDMVGLDKPNIGLLSDEFLEDVKNLPQRNLAMELLEKLLRDEVAFYRALMVVTGFVAVLSVS